MYLLDTHVAIWTLVEPEKLSKKVRELIESDADLNLSAISLWEISLKFAKGKLNLKRGLKPDQFPEALAETGIEIVQPEVLTWASAYNLPSGEHKDPFDRMLIWQAIREKYTLITRDGSFTQYKKVGLKFFF